WPANADGRGSSLELRDPRANNRHSHAWSASFVEGPWQEISYRGLAKNGMSDPTQYNEFIFGLLNAGELLIDDISVVEEPDGAGRELIQNGGFESGGSEKWRLLGNHSRFEVIDDPTQAGNKVLRVTATGPTEHMSNHAETTLRFGNAFVSVSANREYEISFRAKWLGGSNQLNTRLYFNRLPETTLLKTGKPGGSPGAVNSTRVTNLGPGLDELSHSPAVPDNQEPILVRVNASDPDGIAGLTLNYASRGRTFIRVPMNLIEGQWRATIPGQSIGTKIQFFVEATDRRGAVSWLPAAGPSSTALIPVADGQADLDYGDCQPTNLRIVMSDADITKLHESSNVMSNDRLGCTVIVNERLVYYDAGIRLKGSEHGRASNVRVGYNIRFPADRLFLGAHETIAVDRSGAGDQFSQREMMIKHAINHAGDIPGSYDDLIRVIAPRPQHTGAAMLSKARFDREYLVNQSEGDGSGTLFEYELIYVLSSTTGGVEGLKVTQSGEVRGVAPRNLGGQDKELYRWHWQIKNNRTSDDFSPLIEMVTALGRSGSRYQRDTDRLLDVDQWLRAFAVQVLFGIADNYSSGSRHNAMFYHRPSDGKMLYFPWDMDFTFVRGASSSLTPNDDQNRLIRASSLNRRNFYRHLWEIIQSTFNTDYLSEWANHYSCFLPTEDLNRFMPYVRTRSAFALGEIEKAIPQVPFSISTDNNTSTPSSMAMIEGRGWLDVHQIRIAGGENLSIEWTDTNTWRVSVPLRPGPNQIAIEAIDLHGNVIASDLVNLVGTGRVLPAGLGNLAVSEIMYHPGDPSELELAAGWLDAEVFEFIELINLNDEFSVDLGGIEFTEGIRYQFDNTLVRPGERVLLVGNLEAFQTRYGRDLPIVGVYQDQGMNRLSNSGEQLTLVDATGQEMASLEWSDRFPWPVSADGRGYSLLPIGQNRMDLSVASHWRSSATVGGNPASNDSVPLSDWMSDFGVEDFGTDLDGDGWDTVSEYIAGSDPRSSEELPRFEVLFEEGGEGELFLIVDIMVEIGHDDVQIRPLLSSDLEEWSDEIAYAGRWNNGDGTATVQFRSEVPVSDREAQYVQLGVGLWELEED
ncbi:CotH kinase family protein, partial [Verrucomicrobia bacterium]|nr:CotH kinase family protein [Verrucomicrobiota bacterium]